MRPYKALLGSVAVAVLILLRCLSISYPCSIFYEASYDLIQTLLNLQYFFRRQLISMLLLLLLVLMLEKVRLLISARPFYALLVADCFKCKHGDPWNTIKALLLQTHGIIRSGSFFVSGTHGLGNDDSYVDGSYEFGQDPEPV